MEIENISQNLKISVFLSYHYWLKNMYSNKIKFHEYIEDRTSYLKTQVVLFYAFFSSFIFSIIKYHTYIIEIIYNFTSN